MNRASDRSLRLARAVVLLLVLGSAASAQLPVWGQSPNAKTSQPQFSFELRDAKGVRVIGPLIEPQVGPLVGNPTASAAFVFERDYQPGDSILFSGPERIAVQLDPQLPECLIDSTGSPSRLLSYQIPYGRSEEQTGSAYAPESFQGRPHRLTMRAWNQHERSGYRNLALNPCDQLHRGDDPVLFYPHASSNSAARSLYDFEARNAIDGVLQNAHHGPWPYQSWGPQTQPDLWWMLEFGRPVRLDKIRLLLRADFPHDSYWKSAEVEFSDGSRLALSLEASTGFQDFSFSERQVSWLRLTHLLPSDPKKWCSLTELEAWGRDLP